MEESTRDTARELIDQLWDYVLANNMADNLDADDQLQILTDWYGIAEGVIDGYAAHIK